MWPRAWQPAWTPPVDAVLITLAPHPSVLLILGKRDSGKSALGYRLLEQSRPADAIAVFECNVARYPSSANVYDSLGDALDAAGQRERALENYEKACAIAEATAARGIEMYRANRDRLLKELGAQ